MDDGKLVLMGKVAATHGIKGLLRVTSFSGQYDSLLAAETIFLKEPSGRTGTFAVAAATVHGRKLLLALDGLRDINKVEHLVGAEIYLRRDQLPETEEGEYYWHDLIGLQVRTVAGEDLGVIRGIIETGSNDVYVVQGAERELLVPALAEVVTAVDLSAGVMTVSPVPGHFDL